MIQEFIAKLLRKKSFRMAIAAALLAGSGFCLRLGWSYAQNFVSTVSQLKVDSEQNKIVDQRSIDDRAVLHERLSENLAATMDVKKDTHHTSDRVDLLVDRVERLTDKVDEALQVIRGMNSGHDGRAALNNGANP